VLRRGRLVAALLWIAAAGASRAQVPAPEAVLGFRVGADSQLASWRQIGDYFARLAAASPRVRVDTLGPTTQGRPFLLVTITDPANQARRTELLAGQRLLADPRRLTAEDERRLLAGQPAVILISCSIHATEVAASQMAMELAWRLASDSALGRALRDVVVLLVPSANPDGVDIVGDWYRETRGTAYDGTAPPWLYHPYVGHDNNRDFFMLTQVETRHLTRTLYREWFPAVVYDVHQMGSTGPRFFVPPFADPLNPNLDPAIVGGINLVGTAMAAALLDAGRTGVAHQERFDLWWHGGARTVPARHNMIGILSEAASARIASPFCPRPGAIRPAEPRVTAPAAWTPGCWRLRDIVEYELTAAEALVRLAAQQREAFLARFVTAGRRAVEAGRTSAPAAFLLPPDGDAGRAAHLANVLLAAGVEVHRARAAFTADGRRWPGGTLVVRMDQPFRSHAKDLLERQTYPARRLYPGGSTIPPYDVTGWTLPLQMGVSAEPVATLPDADLELLDTATVAAGAVEGAGDIVLLDNTWNGHIAAVWDALRAGGAVRIATAPFDAAGRRWAAGTLMVLGARGAVEAAARRHGFRAAAVRRLPAAADSGPMVRGVPRVGVYRSWNASMDEGWTRWVLEQLGVPYRTVDDSTVRAGELRGRFDVLLFPSESDTAIAFGRTAAIVPARYSGGLGEPGIAAVRAFLAAGGAVIAIDRASEFAVRRLGAPARIVRAAARGGETDAGPAEPRRDTSGARFSAPGSVLRAVAGGPHPIASGYGAEVPVYFISSTILESAPGARVVLRWPGTEELLLSGYLEGGEVLAGRPALLEGPVGDGRVILFGFRPQHRGQTHGTYRLLTNAILFAVSSDPVRRSR
jgi:hypothetical protein